ncbi:hypothetical protein PsYK624_059580 [Phanerochaete sordida]|uniref:F-box domain-containing protein n=1 Tax=Phanerochaete sordida TaxID=48140 RepID=A0A9P3LD13_9APHY|nr:hypothetical protein PsYK624_059580 [Phanerochaete sordida]
MASGAKITDMPLDVYEHLFEVVRLNDVDTRKRTLFAASRVCKAWADLTRHARFHALYLVVRLPGEQSIVRYFLDEFIREPFFAEVRHKQLVKSLTLRWGKEESTSEIDLGGALQRYLPLFPGVRALDLRGRLWQRAPHPPVRRFQLRALKIAGRVSRDGSNTFAFSDLLALFPELEELKLADNSGWRSAAFTPSTGSAHQEIGDEAEDVEKEYLSADEELRVDNIYRGGATEPKGILSIILELSDAPESLAELLSRGNTVKHLELTKMYHVEASSMAILDVCAATLEEVHLRLWYRRYQEDLPLRVPNADLAPLLALRRLTVVVTIKGWLPNDEEEGGLLPEEPWASLAAMLKALHRRTNGAHKLEYIELLLEPRSSGLPREPDPPVPRARPTFMGHLPFTRCADLQLCSLVDASIVDHARATFTGRVPRTSYFVCEAHSCLNDLIVEAFPMLNKKGRLSLKDGACKCGIDGRAG